MLKRNKTRTKNCVRKDVFKIRLKVESDEADDTECGRAFQARAAAAGNARSPSVEQRVSGTVSCDVAAERRCRRVVTSDTRLKLLARYSGAIPCTQLGRKCVI